MADDSTSSPDETPHPAWVRLLLPSVVDVLFVGLLSVLVFTPVAIRLLGDAGIGWHIRTGQQIVATHAIPRVDPFSSTMQGKPWFAWEWMYDMLVGQLERVAGLNGVVWFTAVVIAVVFAWTLQLLVQRGTGLLLALGLVLLAASASMIHFLARPHVVSWLFTLPWFAILDSSERHCTTGTECAQRRRLLWFLPFLMVAWVNVHGGFLIAFVLLGIYWASAAWERFRFGEGKLDQLLLKLRAGQRGRTLGVVGILAALATLANPYGWKLHVHIYQYLSSHFLMDHIDEFQSPNFHGVAQRCFAALLLITFVALAAKARALRLSEGLVVLFAAYAGLYASRNIPISSLLLVLVCGPLLSRAWNGLTAQGILSRLWRRTRTAQLRAPRQSGALVCKPFLHRMEAIESTLQGHLWPIVAVVVTAYIAANGGRLGSRQVMNAHFDENRFPVRVVDFIESRDMREPVLAPDSWGGYLIYRLYPKTLVVVDDRHDLYGEEFLKSYLRMVHVEPGWESFLLDHNARYVLMPRESPLANMLMLRAHWKTKDSDSATVLFERTESR
jgi:hypothetical protein